MFAAATPLVALLWPSWACATSHEGVECDESNVNPIVGTRYHLPGTDYDLCEDELLKLGPSERAEFVAIHPRWGAYKALDRRLYEAGARAAQAVDAY